MGIPLLLFSKQQKPASKSLFVAHMENDMSEWFNDLDAHGDAVWSASAGLAGTIGGMAVTVDDTTIAEWYQFFSVAIPGEDIRSRFYIDPNSIPMDAGEEIGVHAFLNTAGNSIGRVYLRYEADGYKIKGYIFDDAGTPTTTTVIPITDAEHRVEIYIQRAATNVSSDGKLYVWVDGDVGYQAITGIDNYDRFALWNTVILGAGYFVGTPGPGTIYLDEVEINITGDYIGPLIK